MLRDGSFHTLESGGGCAAEADPLRSPAIVLSCDSSSSNLSLVLMRRNSGSKRHGSPFLTQRAHGGLDMPQRTLACRHLLHAMLDLFLTASLVVLVSGDAMISGGRRLGVGVSGGDDKNRSLGWGASCLKLCTLSNGAGQTL